MVSSNSEQEDEFRLTEEQLSRVQHPSSRFTENFTPPPRYPGAESHEMKDLGFPASEAALPQSIPERTATAREAPFDFQFFAPKKNTRRYLVALVIILMLIITILATLSGILGHQLDEALHDSQNTTLTVTMTEQLRFTTLHPTTLVTLTRPLISSTLKLTQTEIQTEYLTASAAPSPTPTLDTSPHATCSAVSAADGGFDVRIWSNYIDSQEAALALAVAIDKKCGGQINVTGWNATHTVETWTEGDSAVWVSDNVFEFQLKEVVLSQSLQCVPQAIVDAGGPPNTPDCG